MPDQSVFVMFLIFVGAVIFASLAISIRQSLLVAYILLGLVLGPYGAKLVSNPQAFSSLGEVGIIFLLFLVGLDLDPRELWQSLKKVSFVTLGSAAILGLFAVFAGLLLDFNLRDSVLISVGMIFSSTVIGLKLMPKHDLFHSRRGELMIGILLLQDLLAIFVLFFLEGARNGGGFGWDDVLTAGTGLPTLLFAAFFGKKMLIRPLAKYFWHSKEYVFLLAIAWCLSMAELGAFLGLSDGVGAFIAGVTIASNSRTALLMRERLNPLRDFFLVLFFFSIGAAFDYRSAIPVLFPGLLFCGMAVLLKPLVTYLLLRVQKEKREDATEVGWRLGQGSEFSLLICALAADIAPRLISVRAEYTIELMTLLSFIVSCYWISVRYPTTLNATEPGA